MDKNQQSSSQKKSLLQIVTYVLIIVGILFNLLFIVPNGDYSCTNVVCGLGIGEWHYHDALWHIAVARNSFQSIPFTFPSAVGFPLTSYNYLLAAMLHILELFFINPFFAYFKLLPVVGNIALVYSLFRYFRVTQKSEWEKFWISFFLYFGSSFSFLLIFYRNNFAEFSVLKGFPVVATLQPAFVLSNIQFFLTLPILLYVFTDLFVKKRSKYDLLVHSVLLALAIGLKIYSGIFVFLLLVLGTCLRNYPQRHLGTILKELFVYSLTSAAAIFVFFLPFGAKTSDLPFLWFPLAIPHAITESPGLFYHKEFTLGRYFMYGLQKVSPRLIVYELISIGLFLLWNLGSRVIVFVGITYSLLARKLHLEKTALFMLGIVGLLVPVFFIQRGGGWYNTIQFAYVGIYFLGILAGIYVAAMWTNRRTLLRLLVIAIVLTTLPNNILMFGLLAKEKIVINKHEIDALSHLREQPPGVVLSFPDDKNSSYVPALSGKTGYLIDYEQAALLGLPIDPMIQKVESGNCEILAEVDYVYFAPNTKGASFKKCPSFTKSFRQIFRNEGVELYRR